jgi:dolichol kinase
MIVILSFLNIDLFINGFTIFVIAVLLSIILAFYFREKLQEVVQTKGEPTPNILGLIMDPKTRTGALVFFIIVLLGTYVLIPRVSMATAKIIRSFTPESEFQYELIYIRDLHDELEPIKGIIVAEQDDVIYISNQKWELEQVKTDKYYVKKYND